MQTLTLEQLTRAVGIRRQIDKLEAQFARIFNSNSVSDSTERPAKRRRISKAGRAKIAAAARKRWAAVRAKKAASQRKE